MTTPIKSRADINTKLVIIGDSGVGKTCVMRRFTDDEYSTNFVATIGIDFKIRFQQIKDKLVKVQIWDTAGQEKFRSITTAYYRGAKGVLIVYDITNRRSYEHVTNWITNFNRWADAGVSKMLIGNKCDLANQREVQKKEGEKLAKENKMFFSETSAKDSINVESSFITLLDEIVEKHNNLKQEEEKQVYNGVSLKNTTSSGNKNFVNERCCKT